MNRFYNFFKPILVLLLLWNGSTSAQTTFLPTGSIASYTVPAGVVKLSITAKGSQGGQGFGGNNGGMGAIITGTFTCIPGDILKVLVGERTTTTFNYAGGGGGGSFVWDATAGNVLMVAAGGGGGGGYSGIGQDAVTAPNGTNGGGGVTYGGGGVGGGGGVVPSYARYAGSGAGWLSNGAAGIYAGCTASGGGIKPLTSGLGGTFGGNASYDGTGGFGGGGGAQGNCLNGYGGGGGGYSGGGPGTGPTLYGGGGGGSFNGGAPQANSVGNTGNGSVVITPICVTPVGGTIIGPNSVCLGYTGNYTDTSATPAGYFGSGTWTSSNPAIASVVPATGVVTGNSIGVDTLTYTIVLTCGTASATKVITVNPLPTPVLGFGDVCPGSHVALIDSTPGGTWTSAVTSIATIGSASGVDTGVSAGITTITYTVNSTGCFALKTVTVAAITGATSVCDGDSILLSSNAPGGYWTSSDTTLAKVDSAGWVTGIGLGTVSIHYTLDCGCTISKLVTVNALAPIVGVDSGCINVNSYLTDIVGGGIWTSTATTVATVTSDSGRVHGLTAGMTIISYHLPNGCFSTVPFTIIPQPSGILGSNLACPQETGTLVDATPGGWWTSGNRAIATIDSFAGVDTGVAPGTVTIYYTVAPGCSVDTTIIVNPLPAPISGRPVICPATKDTLTDPTAYGVWSSTTLSLATVDSFGLVTAIASGNAIIHYTLPITGCYQAYTITVDPLPVPTVTYNWATGTLYATTGFATYQWYDSTSGKIHGATAPSIAATNTDYYYVLVTDSNGCKGYSSAYHYNVAQVGTHNVLSGNGVLIYPNPAEGSVFVESPVSVRVVITSLEGKTELIADQAKQIDISRLANGLHFISVFDGQGNRLMIQKLIKQ